MISALPLLELSSMQAQGLRAEYNPNSVYTN